MKSGRSIQDVSREILRQQEAKADYLVATDRLHMDTWGDSPVIRVLDREGIDQIEPLEIQQTAHQQIGTYLDIPGKYYDRMLQRDPALLSYNVNRWFQKGPEQKLLRTARPERFSATAIAASTIWTSPALFFPSLAKWRAHALKAARSLTTGCI